MSGKALAAGFSRTYRRLAPCRSQPIYCHTSTQLQMVRCTGRFATALVVLTAGYDIISIANNHGTSTIRFSHALMNQPEQPSNPTDEASAASISGRGATEIDWDTLGEHLEQFLEEWEANGYGPRLKRASAAGSRSPSARDAGRIDQSRHGIPVRQRRTSPENSKTIWQNTRNSQNRTAFLLN